MRSTTRLVRTLSAALAAAALSAEASVCLIGKTDKSPMSYKCGEKIVFSLKLVNGRELPEGSRMRWRLSSDAGEHRDGKVELPIDAPFKVETKMDKPGFVRLEAVVIGKDGKDYLQDFAENELTPDGKRPMNQWEKGERRVFFDGGAAVEPSKLESVPEPKDFGLAVCAAPERTIDGNEWQDMTRMSLGREETRASFAPFADEKAALEILPWKSSRQVLLDSDRDWKFKWSKDPASRCRSIPSTGRRFPPRRSLARTSPAPAACSTSRSRGFGAPSRRTATRSWSPSSAAGRRSSAFRRSSASARASSSADATA